MFLRWHALLATCILLEMAPGTLRADPEADFLKARVAQLEAEVKLLKERLAKLEGDKKPSADSARPLTLSVIPGDWGSAPPNDIRAVCRSVAQEFTPYFPKRDFDPISIRHDAKQGPMVIYGKGPDGDRRVLLNTKDTYWAQFSYQFAHELCHVLCNYRDSDKANLWFEESLCETASLFALRRMAETWKTKPPYSNWKSYGEKLFDYAENRLKDAEKLDEMTFAQWYLRNEPALHKTGTDRKKNQVVAVALLPMLEKNPHYWQAVGYLNQWDPKRELSFGDYLSDWHERVPKELKPFVADVAKLFEVTIK